VKGGIANARKQGKQIGRKKGSTGILKFDPFKDRIIELRGLGLSYSKIAGHIEFGTAPAIQNYLNKVQREEV